MKLAWPVLLCALAGCDDCKEGNEGCPCFANETCNGELACRSETCVNLSASGGKDDDDSEGVDLDACMSCAEEACDDELSTCEDTEGCEGFVDCVIGCGSDVSCQTDCTMQTSGEAQTQAVLVTACAYVACPEECAGASAPEGPGTGPSQSPAVTPGLMPGDPVVVSPEPGGPEPEPGGPDPEPEGPNPDPEPEATLLEGTNWLALSGEGAPSTEAPNSLLGIEGVFYAYDDGCAAYEWDPVTRCISGTHCAPSAQNWGVGVGFDFYNDGTEKRAWSAADYAARGIAWSVFGPDNLQIWLTNMDPSFGTSCEASGDCGIAGPPDGYPSVSNSGTMFFDNLSKDDWGGSGIVYTFDPARLLSIQFKLPASSAFPMFSLCIDRLGIIL